MVIIGALESVFTIVIMISIGYILAHRGWFDDNAPRLFSRILINVSIPAFVFSNLISSFDKDRLLDAGIGIIVPFAAIGVSYGISMIVSRVLKIRPERRGAFQAMFAFANSIFVGLPVNLALFGEESTAFALL